MIATACWIIEGDDSVNQCKGATHTPGTKIKMGAYRAEMFGMYCILLCLYYICLTYNVRTRKVKIICDCLGALTRAIIYENCPTTSHLNFDLLWSIFDLRDELPLEIE